MQLLLVAGERAPHKGRAQLIASAQVSIGGRSLITPVFSFEPKIRGRRKLALGQPIHAVVFDDVDHRQIAPHQVNELPDADGRRIAVAADAQRDQTFGSPASRPSPPTACVRAPR